MIYFMTGRIITMSWIKNRKLWIVVLAILIIAVNAVTAVRLINRFSKPDILAVFKTPDSIVLCENGKIVEISRNDESFDRIISLNKSRADIVQGYLMAEFGNLEYDYMEGEIDKNDINAIGDLYIKYVYDKPYKFDIETNFGRESVAAKSISFILTGEFGSQIYIEKEQGHVTLGYLNTSSELINLVRDALNN